MILKAYKYRVYPNKDQVEFLHQNFGAVRFVWNQLVANFNSWSKDGPNQPMSEKILKDKEEFDWLNETISYALQQKRIDFDETKKQYFNSKRKTKLGRMKFKKKGVAHDSFRIPGQALKFNKCIDFETRRIKLPKMSSMKIVIDRKFSGKLKSVTLSKNKTNQYFVSVLVEEQKPEPLPNTYRAVGIDLGLNDLAVLSNGIKITNPRWFVESQDKLAIAQRHLSRKQKGSNLYNRQRLKVARIHQKISNQRNWFHHNLSSWLVNNYDYIYMEDLAVEEMKQSRLAKSVSDVSWYSLTSMIKYKSSWYSKDFAKVDRYFASSQICSSCGHQDGKKSLSIRGWVCPVCGEIHDRDINAAKNIEKEASSDLVNWIKRGIKETSEELPEWDQSQGSWNRHGVELSPPACSVLASTMKCPENTFIRFL
jgi:putative transposase